MSLASDRVPQPPAKVNRRAFLGAAAAATASVALPRRMRAAAATRDKLNIAVVGVGGQGTTLLRILAELGVNLVALCDVDADYAAATFAAYPQARRYVDFRDMLERERDLDGVVVATPDHLHAVVAMAVLQHGRHVYGEKPLTRTVVEARRLTEAARRAGVATQMGNQGMAFAGNQQLEAWLADGEIGAVREVHVWSDRPTQGGKLPLWWPQGVERPAEAMPVPPTLDWDRWLGPAPFRPYHSDYAPFRWRGWWDFGTGGLGDMGIHNLAPVFRALKLGAPAAVSASSTPQVGDSVPLASLVHFEFPARPGWPAVTVHWYDGGLLPPRPAELPEGEELNPEDGTLFVGDRGKILVYGWGGEHPRLLGRETGEKYRRPLPDADAHRRHVAEWLAACKSGTPTRSSFDFAGPLTEAVLVGAACVRHGGRRLTWDSGNLQFTNDPAANQHVHYAYREGWTLG